MPATEVYRDEGTKPDGSRYEMVVWKIPASEDFPQGLKYSFQYMDAGGDTLLRFDNSPHHPEIGRHHRHTSEGNIEALEYTSVADLIDQFQNEVNEIYERRTN